MATFEIGTRHLQREKLEKGSKESEDADITVYKVPGRRVFAKKLPCFLFLIDRRPTLMLFHFPAASAYCICSTGRKGIGIFLFFGVF